MKFVFLLICFRFIKVTLSDNVLKCCLENEVLREEEENYKCIPDLTKRLQINANKTNVLKDLSAGNCHDVLNNNFIRLDIGRNQIFPPEGQFFPKCCPLNYVYNTQLHSCIPKQNLPNYFVDEIFIKVGLTNCKTIADFDLKQHTDFKLKLINSTSEISRNSLEDPNSFCIDKNENEGFILRECQTGIDSCDHLKCIKKCCPDGQSFVNGSKCKDSYEHGMNLSYFRSIVENHQENFAIIHNRTCSKIYRMDPLSNFTIHKNGSFTEWIPNNGFRTEHVGDMNSYCLEHLKKDTTNGYYLFHCFPEEPTSLTKFDYRLWPFIMSCVFLILTVVVYIIIKEWRKMFGKILINYCIASIFVFGILSLGQSKETPTIVECQLRAFFLIFFAIAQFSWANVMSFEIWFTFGTTRIYLGSNQKEMELKKFLLYSLYGWGAPLLLTLTTLLFFRWKVLPYAIQPFIGEVKCFFDVKPGNYAKFVFMNIPLLIIQIINMALFVKTVTYCVNVRNEINKRNDGTMTNSAKKFSHDRERLFLILKLSIVMGICFIFEVVTAFFNMSDLGTVPKYIEIILDLFNALQGVFIFIIFICKKKILLALAQKCTIFGVYYTPSSSSIRTHSSITINGVGLNTIGNQSCQKVV